MTGGASGLGRAIAQRLLSEGANVIISDIQRELGLSAAKEDGFAFLEQNVCDEARWRAVIDQIETHFGSLNILVNNAGVLGSLEAADPESTSLQCWREVFAVNVEGVFLGCRIAIAAMRKAGRGSIINLSSMADRLATPHATAYGASKAAVRQLTRSIAQHCAQQKFQIRCNSVHPGMVRTPLLDGSLIEIARRRGVALDGVASELRSHIPLGDFTAPEDVAAAVAFLASDDSRHITGAALVVDGGIVHCNTYRHGEAVASIQSDVS